MKNGVTITLSPSSYKTTHSPLQVGTKIALNKKSPIMMSQRIKNKRMVFRLLGKEFRAYFKIMTVNKDIPYAHTFTIKPYNF